MKTNYHNHTYRCNHASMVSDEEYVLKAIENGYKEIGFSEHAMFPDILECDNVHPSFFELEDYLDSINKLKEKYKNKIKIFVAMECEYFSCYHDYLKSLIEEKKVDYLIFGNHFLHHEEGKIYGEKGEWSLPNYPQLYCKHAIEALNSGLFKIFAHPDIFFMSAFEMSKENFNWIKKMCLAAKKNKVFLEINQGGMRRKLVERNGKMEYPYPCVDFWKIAKKCNNKVVIGVDAHAPGDYNHDINKEAHEFAKRLKIKIKRRIRF